MSSRIFSLVLCTFIVLVSFSCKKAAPTEIKKPDRVPYPPINLAVKSTSLDAIDLSWGDLRNEASAFVILRYESDSTGWEMIDSIDGSERTYQDAGLPCRATYFYKLYSVNDFGRSPDSDSVKATTKSEYYNLIASDQTSTTNSLYGVALGSNGAAIAVGAHGTILQSADNGSTWESVESNTSHDLHGVIFNSVGDGIIVGDNATILKMHNGVVSSVLHTSVSNGLLAIASAGGAGLVVVGEQGIVLRSIDNGNGWVRYLAGVSAALSGVTFISEMSGIAVSTQGDIIKTTDGGNSWARQFAPVAVVLSGATFTDSLHGIAFGWNTILHTSNGGATWTLTDEVISQVNGASFLDKNFGIAVGARGILYRTVDGGMSWTHSVLNSQPYLLAMRQGDDGSHCLAVGMRGVVAQLFFCR